MRRPIVYAAFLAAVLAGLLHAQGDGKQKGDPKIPADGEKTITTESGLQYSVLTKGKGTEKPRMGDKVKVHYSGWLTDGKLFDSSVKRGAPMEFVLGAVIEGWNEGLQLMVPGDRFKFTIPSKLGYGEMGSPGSIPPNATLVFEVELISFLAMPRFQALDAKKAKTTKSGLRYQILKEGTGDACKDTEAFELKFAFWNKDKQLVQCTEQVGGTIKGKSENMRLAFLKEAPQLMKAGAVILFEVPAKLAWGAQRAGPLVPANSTTFWKLELVRIMRPLPLPKFSLPKDDELKKTPTGLKYQVIKEGKGPKPKPFDTVTCHYAGWLTDGTLFDSSYGRGDTSSFPLSGVIKGWTEGLQLMNVGSKYKFVIPGDLAYGPQGSPPKIGPNATLVFIVELVKIGK